MLEKRTLLANEDYSSVREVCGMTEKEYMGPGTRGLNTSEVEQGSHFLVLGRTLPIAFMCFLVLADEAIKAIDDDDDRAQKKFPIDCDKLSKESPSGVYVIKPALSTPVVVYCDMDTEGKGWTVVQRNSIKTEITWLESWTTYKYGFGNVLQDYWMGNEYIHLLTTQRTYMVRFVLKDKAEKEWYADYDIFSLDNEVNGYTLRLGRYSGTAGDYLTTFDSGMVHHNMRFSTKDKDQDRSGSHCANSYGGWWYDKCYNALLNGKGYIYWRGICTGDCSFSKIMVRPSGI
ncbi:fibrinogen-like protein 1-like protein [Bombina bombina]|uniref:fibrinogen-like protein 1-like protein n=1 Tax=Bombina bombina TaxID=8345 RepID=UPI00235A9BEC|nr:fibrinogen-like protein 1-like protein [Bombina bombina]